MTPETLYKGGGAADGKPTEYEAKHYYGDTEVDNYYITKGIKQANSIGYEGWLALPVEYLLKKYKK